MCCIIASVNATYRTQHGKWSLPPAAHLVILATSSLQDVVSWEMTLIVMLYSHKGMPTKDKNLSVLSTQWIPPFGQKLIDHMSFSQHIMVMSVGQNVRTSNVTINWGGGIQAGWRNVSNWLQPRWLTKWHCIRITAPELSESQWLNLWIMEHCISYIFMYYRGHL
jgi:hypothetical protein